jgi:hypothetical protein
MMSQSIPVASAPTLFVRRAFDWWVAQVKHALLPTVFFFVGSTSSYGPSA